MSASVLARDVLVQGDGFVLGGLLGVLTDLGVVREVLDDGVQRRGQGYGDQGAGDAGDDDAEGDRDDHAERVHRDEPAHQEGLEDVRLELLHAAPPRRT